jgi:hypothetical protein
MARKSNNGADGFLVKKWQWKYQGVEADLSSHLCGEDEEPVGQKGAMERTEDKRPLLVKEQVLDIELRLLENLSDDSLPRTVKAAEFKLVCKALDLCVVGTDIEALRLAMWAQLEKAHEIKWEKWYLIQIASAQSFKGDFEVGFALSQNTIYRGVAKDGTILMREFERGRSFGPWRYKPWPGVYQDKGGHVIACIQGTAANDAALDEFRDRIRALQKMIGDLVKPDVILSTLANLSGIGLPAPHRPELAEDDV